MHTVIETPTYISGLKRAGVGAHERQGIVDMLAANPTAGDLIKESGGARKVRYARDGAGKSGSYRVITFFGGDDVPVFLLDIYEKGRKATLSDADRHALAKVLPKLSAAYRAGSRGGCSRDEEGRSIDMTEAGKRLLEAANEALAIAEGRADSSTYIVHAPPAVDVRAIRKSVNMTQAAFGERFGFGTARVRDWEQNRTRPTASDRVLPTTIRYAPSVVLKALEAGETPEASSDATHSGGGEVRATQTRRAVARTPRQKSVA